MRVLVTGATGYIGGRLVPRLLEAGHEVVVLTRDAAPIGARRWASRVTVHVGDMLDRGTLSGLGRGLDATFYLVHSMGSGPGFAQRDRTAAEHFASAVAGVPHTVYLGGLLPDAARSEHLRSRAETGRVLRENLPVTEFRAGPIIGSGSASFEMVRYLTERLPAMVAPRWILNDVQPIGVREILRYLVAALDRGPAGVVDVGADVLSFKRMMEIYAEVRGLRRVIVPVPVLAPKLAARWVGLVTPIPNALAVPLIAGIVQPVRADLSRARELFPAIDPVPYREAVERAVAGVAAGRVETRWSGARGSAPTYRLEDREGLIQEVRSYHVPAPAEAVFAAFSSLGGEKGWLVWNWAWRLRGALDKLVGGPGLRRGRRHPQELLPGEAVDFWRVDAVEPPRLLRLRAEMKLPGRAWLQWEAEPEGEGTRLVQVALFEPVGSLGALYWYALYPIHKVIFSAMVRAVGREALAAAADRPLPGPPAR